MAASGVERNGKLADPELFFRQSHPQLVRDQYLPPGHAQDSHVTTTVRASVRAINIWAGVVSNHTSELLSASEGKSVGSVLQKNGAARRHVADLRGVIALNVHVLVDDLVPSLRLVEAVAVCVKCPRVEVDLWALI